MGSGGWRFRGRSFNLDSGTSVMVLNSINAWVCVCVAGVSACPRLLMQQDATQLHVPVGCALCGHRFCVSSLLHPFLTRCSVPVQSLTTSYKPQNDRTGGKMEQFDKCVASSKGALWPFW